MRRHLASVPIGLLLLLLPVNPPPTACTIAIISGEATCDGRPLLWKNRDINYNRQEVRYFDDGNHGGYLALVTPNASPTTTSYMGLNETGFAIMNAFSRDLSTGSPTGHGTFMKLALRECGSVADFEALLIATSARRGHIWSNFGVIDGQGGASLFEVNDTDYRRYDAIDAGGFIVRANNSLWGGGDLGSRYHRAAALIDAAVSVDLLDVEFMLRSVARDLGETPSMPCGQWPALEPALNRHNTRSSVVVHGVRIGEDPRLATYWCTLGEPSCGVSVPLWPCAGSPPLELFSPGLQAPLNLAILEQELYCYDTLNFDTTINTNALVGNDGLGGIQRYSLQIEQEALDATAARLDNWRMSFPAIGRIAAYQAARAERSLLMFTAMDTPDETPLPPADNPVATPAPAAVQLAWVDPPIVCESVEIWRALWADADGHSLYPTYGNHPAGNIPERPADRTAAALSEMWQYIGEAAGGVEQFSDPIGERGVYHYELFPRLANLTYGPPAVAEARSINYLLGDVGEIWDGLVAVDDLTALSAAWGLPVTSAAFNHDCDIAPTHDRSPTGVPEPDSRIDFEDLMICALNFDHGSAIPPLNMLADEIALVWEPVDDETQALLLRAPCPGLKGLRLRTSPSSGSISISEGALLADQSAPVCLLSGDQQSFDAGCVILGPATWIAGEGELLRIAGDVQSAAIQITARNLVNETLLLAPIPPCDRLRLDANFPNPFNPVTRINYFLASRGSVLLEVFAPSGRHVATLAEGVKTAGRHEVNWDGCGPDGRRLASGVYLYRLTTAGESRMRRLCLLK
ncbi:MAG: T9SS type A sorting domain-containing protein [bacterium]|nr:T9SS type A sorting domain-containing protein [bacterium]